MIIDIHTHVFPDKIASRALDSLATAACIDPNTDGTLTGLIQSMKQNKISYSITLPAVTNPLKVTEINDRIVETLDSQQAAGILPFAGMHPDFEGYREELHRIKKAGVKGIKLHPAYQKCDFDDIRMMRIVDAASEEGLLVLVHGGIDIGLYDHNYASVEHILKVLDTVHPQGLIMAHMANWANWEQVEAYLAGADFYMDTAFTIGEIRPYKNVTPSPYCNAILSDEEFCRLVNKHGADKVLFGTDSPWQDQGEYSNRILSMKLTKEEKEMILWKNAFNLLGLSSASFSQS